MKAAGVPTSGHLGYMEDDLMEDDLKSFFRPFSNLKNWIMT